MGRIALATIVFGLIGLFFSLFLAFLNRKLQVEENPKVKKILDILPGLNCGACGFSSCRAFAEAVAAKPQNLKECRPAGDEANQKIAELSGKKRSSQKNLKSILVCACTAEKGEKKTSTLYQGLKNCQAAQITGGALDCDYGCFGFGDCQKACPNQAIIIRNKKVYIDYEKCFLCGKCLKACPRKLFKIIPKSKAGSYFIACQNKDALREVKTVCSRGCIACGICARAENSPYQMKENLPQINYVKADEKNLKKGKDSCPVKCINSA